MTKITSDGYITDGQGGSEKLALELGFNFQIHDENLEGFSLRLSEAGKKIEDSREMGVTLSPAQWRQMIAGMQRDLDLAEEFLAQERE